MQTLRLCVFLAFIVAFNAYPLPGVLPELYCAVNGDYNNKEQVEKNGGNQTLLDVRIVPIYAPALSQLPVFYVEEFNKGSRIRTLILTVTGGEGDTVFINPNNFTGNTDIKPGTFDPNIIKTFTLEDLHGNPSCKQSYTRGNPFVFTVNWPDCMQTTVEEGRENYGSTVTCDDWIAIIPAEAPENPTLVPYQVKRKGLKYPLENAPDNYDCTCDKPSY